MGASERNFPGERPHFKTKQLIFRGILSIPEGQNVCFSLPFGGQGHPQWSVDKAAGIR